MKSSEIQQFEQAAKDAVEALNKNVFITTKQKMDSLASSPDRHKKSTWDNQLGVNQRTLHESAWDTYEQLRSFYTNRLIILSGFEQHEAATVCSFASTAVKRLVQNSESTLQVALDNVDSWAGNPQDEIDKWVDDVQKLVVQTLDRIHQDLEVYKIQSLEYKWVYCCTYDMNPSR